MLEEGVWGGSGPKIGPFGEWFLGAHEVAKSRMKGDQGLNYESVDIYNDADIEYVVIIEGR